MSRDLTVSMAAAVAASTKNPVILVFLDLIGGAVRAHSGIGDLVFGGNTFLGVGTFGGISPVEESKSVAANGITLTLSAPSAFVALSLSEYYRGRKVRVWLGMHDNSTGALIADPTQIFGGRIDGMSIQETGDTSSITVACESRLIDLNRARERRYTDEEQKRLYPGDKALEFVTSLAGSEVAWGVPNKAPVVSPGKPTGDESYEG